MIEREEGVGLARGPGALCTGHKTFPCLSHRARVASDFGVWGMGLHHFRFGFLQTHLHTGHPSSVRRVRDSWILPLSTLLPRGNCWYLDSGLRRSPALLYVQYLLMWLGTYARSPQHCTADGCGMPVSFVSLEIISHGLQPWEHLFVHLGLHWISYHCPRPRETRDNARRLKAKCQSKWEMAWGPTSTLDVWTKTTMVLSSTGNQSRARLLEPQPMANKDSEWSFHMSLSKFRVSSTSFKRASPRCRPWIEMSVRHEVRQAVFTQCALSHAAQSTHFHAT